MTKDSNNETVLLSSVTQENDVIIKFETTNHSISAILMAKTLLAFNSSVMGFAEIEHLDSPGVSVKTVKSGCIEIGAVISSLKFAGVTLDYMKNILENLKSLYDLYVFLKGAPPAKTTQKPQQVLVQNSEGATQTFSSCVFNQYMNCSNTFIGNGEDLLQDPSLSSISILDEQRNPKVTIPRDKFVDLVPYKKLPSVRSEQIDEKECLLTIATINLNKPKEKWKFLDEDGNFFVAKIQDDSFIKKVLSGLVAFRQGDKFKCAVEIQKKFDPFLDSYVVKQRIITHVLQHYPRSNVTQQEFQNLE